MKLINLFLLKKLTIKAKFFPIFFFKAVLFMV
jgi:hypothetical protein